MKSFGQAIRQGRYSKFLQGKEAAEKLGLCRNYLYKIENEEVPASLNTIKSALKNEFITQEEANEFIQQVIDRKHKARVKSKG